MKFRRDQDSGLLVPQRERVWAPHRDRRLNLVVGIGPSLYGSASDLASALLMKFDSGLLVDGNTTQTNTLGSNGSPAQITTSPKWGSHCAEVDNASADENFYATGPGFRTGTTGKFTLDFWFWPINDGTTTVSPSVLNHAICVLCGAFPIQQHPSSNVLTSLAWTEASGGTFYQGTASLATGVSAGTWHHVRACLNDSPSSTQIWLNGTRVVNITNISGAFTTIYFGNQKNAASVLDGDAADHLTNCRFDSIRILKDQAISTGASITVPAADFDDI